MSIRKALRFGLVALESVTLVLVLSACATGSGAESAKSDSIAVAIDNTLAPTPGYGLSEGQVLTQRDRLVYESTRHGGNHSQNTGTGGSYVTTAADEGRIWHWGS